MKLTIIFAAISFLFISTALPLVPPTVARPLTPRGSAGTIYLPADANIKVYFVNGMFSVEQRKVIWDAMQGWQTSRKKRGTEIRFIDSGGTSGLIDCEGCLTVVRQEIFGSRSKKRSSFNALRHDEMGRLASAWIGLDHNSTSRSGLGALMLEALGRGLGV